jgi:tRNA nucleotidyltransferase (CCA-adding enzyme)
MTATVPVHTLILAHANVDFDAFAGMLAAQLLYPGARVCLHGGVNRNVREFYNLHADQIPSVEAAAVDRKSVRRIVLVEVTDIDRLGDFAELGHRDDVEVIAFDHHRDVEADGGTATLVGRDGSVVTGLLRLLLERGAVVSPMHATAFALGIHEDTGSLTYTSTTYRDVEALAACVRLGANQELLGRYLRGPLQPDQRNLLRLLTANRAETEIAGLRVVSAWACVDSYVEDVSTLASRVGEVSDWDVLVLSVEMEGRVLLVGRSRTAALAVDGALAAFGGGGHAQAASGFVRAQGPDEVLERVLAEVARVARAPLRAREVMSTPVHAVASTDEISATLVECQRLGLSGIQVSENGDLTGTVSREDLDRAVRHGLSHAPVKGVMSTGVPVIGGDATLGELRELLATGRAGRLVVVGEGPYRSESRVPVRVAQGVVTRGDLLRALHEPAGIERPLPDPEATAAVRARLGEISRLAQVLPAIERVAAAHDPVFLVGGAVRDVLLGEQSLDLDLMVEGDALGFAVALASELGVTCHPHEKFQTAVVKGTDKDGNAVRIDVATARTEVYVSPGALPEVERSTLRHDMARRDFTINAMATSLRAADLGATYDFFGGFRDLRRRTVRVLHNLSFVEDPTRLLRAVRYEARLGFEMDRHTLSLARGCIEMRLVGDLASARLRDELIDLLGEPRTLAALARMSEIGLDKALHPGLDAGPETRALVARASEIGSRAPFSGRVRMTLVRLALLCRRLGAAEIYDWLSKLKLRRRDQDVVAATATLGPSLADRLGGDPAPAPSALREALDGVPLEALLVAVLTASDPEPVENQVRAYVELIRDARLEINGDDLKQAGVPESPAIGRALQETLALKLDGFVEGRDEELRTALRLLRDGEALERAAVER